MRAAHSVATSKLLSTMSRSIDLQSIQKEGRMVLALQAYKDGHFTSKRATADAYDLPESTFRSRVNGVPARRDLPPTNRKLTDLEESRLIQWILSMESRGLPLMADSIRQMANLLLQKRSRTNTGQDNIPTVGQRWVYNFVRRHDSLQSKYTRKYDYQRALCEDPTILRAWF